MTFVSFSFIIFTAVAVIMYFIFPIKYRWIVLLLFSLAFFFISSNRLILVLLAQTLICYFTALILEEKNNDFRNALTGDGIDREEKKALKISGKKRLRIILTIGIVLDLGILLFLKYFNFFGGIINGVTSLLHIGAKIPELRLLLPIGISFYTLQSISYMIDVYHAKAKAQRNPAKLLLYFSYFPQIVQGPIAVYNKTAPQLYQGHTFDCNRLVRGFELIICGFMKKLIIADRIAKPVDTVFDNYGDYSGFLVFLGAAFYGLQVYADFSGGMDIAVGISEIIGIQLEANFRRPYLSTSIEDFWRRWHITLGGWMRDYVFYPLSLSKLFVNLSRKTRKYSGNYLGKRLPSFISMFIVYFLVGFWHGASWKYIAYGIWNGIFIVLSILLEDVYIKIKAKLHIDSNAFSYKLFRIIRTFIIVSVGRYFSRGLSFKAAVAMLKSSFNKWWDLSFLFDGTMFGLGLNNANWVILFIAIAVLLTTDYIQEKGMAIRQKINEQPRIFRIALCIFAIVLVLIFGEYGPTYDSASFIYGQF